MGVLLRLAVGAASSIFGAMSAGKNKREAARRARRANKKLESLEANRQAVINPYDRITSLAGMATDLSSQMTNPYNTLSVATQAAEMQIEEADIALANTLDTLRATGSSAGGATALAQAALKSKKQVSASIENQEANNEKMRAQGEAQLQADRLAEKKRIQNINMSEGARAQTAEASGRGFVFSQQENREITQLNRVAAQMQNAQMQEAQAAGNETQAWMSAANSLAQGAVNLDDN